VHSALLLIAGAFAFANNTGTRLIVTADLSDPAALHTALCGSQRFPVTFNHRQTGDQPRQTPANFDRLAGHVYRVRTGKIAPGATCFLAPDELLRGSVLVSSPTLELVGHSIVVRAGRRRMSADYPDLRRVDDDGVVDAHAFHVVFLLRRGPDYLLGIEWHGAEGDNLSLFTASGKVLSDYWYRAPL